MGWSIRVKTGLAGIFERSGLTGRKLSARSNRGYPILMYHRIASGPDPGEASQAGMRVAPSTFDMHLGYLAGIFRIVPLSEIPAMRSGSFPHPGEKPVCALTFDDGWSDFFSLAYPILRARDVPATVFLPTGFIGTGQRFWTDTLADLLGVVRNGSAADFPGGNPGNPLAKRILSLTGAPETILEEAIALLKSRRDEEIHEILGELRKTRGGAHPREKERAFLDWDEVRRMRESGLITFGSHTANHRILVHLDDGEVARELEESKTAMVRERAADLSFLPFSYPNGNHDERIVRMVRDAGYHLAVTTESGWNGPETPPFRLRRIAVHQDMTSTKDLFGCRIAGLL